MILTQTDSEIYHATDIRYDEFQTWDSNGLVSLSGYFDPCDLKCLEKETGCMQTNHSCAKAYGSDFKFKSGENLLAALFLKWTLILMSMGWKE